VPSAEITDSTAKKRLHWQRLAALLIVVLVTVGIVLLRDRLGQYQRYGYFGVFISTLAGSATIILPVPSLAIVYVAGSVWNPILVGLAAGLGDAVGEATGYLTGYAGQGLVENQGLYRRFENWMLRNGFLTILILSAVPNPFFDLAGIAAGASRFPGRWFFLAAWLGKSVKDLVFAIAGYYSINFFAQFLAAGLSSLQR
jgi:uncharacterized membrane protein YdjX (TVP38/TMEM64 family)